MWFALSKDTTLFFDRRMFCAIVCLRAASEDSPVAGPADELRLALLGWEKIFPILTTDTYTAVTAVLVMVMMVYCSLQDSKRDRIASNNGWGAMVRTLGQRRCISPPIRSPHFPVAAA